MIHEGSSRPTQVMHRANLIWPVLMRYLEVLLRHQLLSREMSMGRTTYRVTTKGSAVLNIYLKLREEIDPLESEAIQERRLDLLREPALSPGDKSSTLSTMRSVLGAADFRLGDQQIHGRSGTKYRFDIVAEGLNKSLYGFDILTHASENEVIRVFVKQLDSDIPVHIVYTKSASEAARRLARSYSLELVHLRDFKDFAELLAFHDGLLSKGGALLEVDPSQSYESVLRELVQDETKSSPVSVFTWRGSPVYRALPRNESVIVYLMSTQGSKKSPRAQAGEFVVPSHDEAALLKSIERPESMGDAADERGLLIFDSVSELLVSLGNERSQSFLRRATHLLDAKDRRSLFIVKRGYHDERSMRMVEGLFSNRLIYDGSGLRLDRRV